MDRGITEATDVPVFVSEHPARRYAVRAAVAALILLFAAWAVALATGVSGLGGLPGLPDPASGHGSEPAAAAKAGAGHPGAPLTRTDANSAASSLPSTSRSL